MCNVNTPELLAKALESLQDGVIVTDASQTIVFVNDSVLAQTGYTREEVVGQTPKLFQCHQTTDTFKNSIRATLARGDSFIGTTVNRRKDGTTYHVELYVAPIHGEGGITHYVGTQRDIIRRGGRHFESFFDVSTHLLIILDVDGTRIRINTINALAEKYLNPEWCTCRGLDISFQCAGLEEFVIHAKLCTETCEVTRFEQVINTNQGERVVEFTLVPVVDGNGVCVGLNCVGEDITSEKEALEHIHFLAYHDSLTELPNRVLMTQRMNAEIERSRRFGHPFALLFLDLDNFKQVNDTMGHGVGDKLLKKVAKRLSSAVRKNDLVARLGGDEFAVIMTTDGDALADAETLATRIIAALSLPFEVDEHRIDNIGVSVGVALFPNHATSRDELFRNADIAMYHAKRTHGNCHTVFVDVFGGCKKDCEHCDLKVRCFGDSFVLTP